MDTSLFYWNSALGKTLSRELVLRYEITGATTVSPLVQGLPCLPTFAALTQQTIDDFLGSSSEFTAAQFDATSMGADAFGGIVNLAGQVQYLQSMEAMCYSAAAGDTLVSRGVKSIATLQDSTLASECAVSSLGNIGFKVDFGNVPDFDALTAGMILIKLAYISK